MSRVPMPMLKHSVRLFSSGTNSYFYKKRKMKGEGGLKPGTVHTRNKKNKK